MEDCPEGVLDKESIIKIYEQISDNGEGSKDFVERIFRIFDKDGSGSIDFKEFMDAIQAFTGIKYEHLLLLSFPYLVHLISSFIESGSGGYV